MLTRSKADSSALCACGRVAGGVCAASVICGLPAKGVASTIITTLLRQHEIPYVCCKSDCNVLVCGGLAGRAEQRNVLAVLCDHINKLLLFITCCDHPLLGLCSLCCCDWGLIQNSKSQGLKNGFLCVHGLLEVLQATTQSIGKAVFYPTVYRQAKCIMPYLCTIACIRLVPSFYA